MSLKPRWYQQQAIDKAIEFFHDKKKGNAIQILPTGSGKSVIIANIAAGIEGKTLILQPSKEILIQNVRKYAGYGFRAGVYSASAGQKHIEKVTFATIGSIVKKPHLFREVKNIIVDEAHEVNPNGGMYDKLFEALPHCKILGLTATPYRLCSNSYGAELIFLTRQTPRIFSSVNYYVQNDILFNEGHLAKLEYFSLNVIDRTMLSLNSTGTEYTDQSWKAYKKAIDMDKKIIEFSNRLLAKRKNLLVFCSLIDEAYTVSKGVPGSVVLTGETPADIRDKMLSDFKSGRIQCVINVGVLTTGFDYPELEAVLIGRSTMSLALYYQIVGRVMRPHKDKLSGWVVDLGGNISKFGKIETMRIQCNEKGLYYITNEGKQLTNVPLANTG